ncbi:MAG: cbb3-type cytochrome c oxidase subunit I [Actinomycetota bacterium]|nr:cbb3-type cytochrome c oxidase subunit I [Actinomycetota bacterium]
MSTIDTHASSAQVQPGAGLACIAEWIGTTDHKRLGRMYLGASALTLIGSAVAAVLLGVERVSPTKEWLDVGSLTQLFALERFGFTYLVLLPLLVGAAIAIVPLQVGARALALPRLAAAGFWMWLLGAGLAVFSLANNGGPGGGNGRFVDLFILSTVLVLVGLLASVGAVATTILTTRAPGMNLRRVPYFTWSVLVASLCLLIALPVLTGDLLYLFVAHRYPSLSELASNQAISSWAGFGFTQPTTIILALPVLGFLADTAATASGERLRPRGPIFLCIALGGVAVFGSVLHTSPGLDAGIFHGEVGELIRQLIPFGIVQGLPLLGIFSVFAFSAQHLGSRPKVQTPVTYGLLAAVLLLGGATANLVAHIGDAELGGTTFEEGTWLSIVFAGVLAAMGAVTYWGPKWWGRSLPVKPALGLALLAFLGAQLATVPLLIAGFADQLGGVFPAIEAGNQASAVNFSYSGPMELWNALSAAGLVLVLLAVLAFVALSLRSFLKGDAAGDDPWNGQTLEWATTSPAPANNFAAVHIVKSAEPLLDLKPSTRSDA